MQISNYGCRIEVMKPTLQRLRSVMSTNLNHLIMGSILTMVIYLIGFILIGYIPELQSHLVALVYIIIPYIFIFFLIPIFIYIFHTLSFRLNGITKIELNPIIVKHNIFFSAGVFWISTGASLIAILLNFTYLIFFSAFLTLIFWTILVKQVIQYVSKI